MSGIPASVRLNITDAVVGLDVDNAVTLRLLHFDKEQREIERKLLAYEVARTLFGGEETPTHPLIAGDRYADENTVIA